jgi:hypothetical protein
LPQPVTITAIPFRGAQDYLEHFADRIKLALAAQSIDRAIGLIDFFRSGIAYRGDTVQEKYQSAKQELELRVKDARFIQHFAVHETEAWLLSDHSIFPAAIRPDLPKTSNPETINSAHPPAAILNELYVRRLTKKYKKPIAGASLFAKLDPNITADRCPHLKLLLDDILRLAR